MSIPPSSQPPYDNQLPSGTPPGGFVPSPPPKPSGGSSVGKMVGIGCLGLFLFLAIGGVLLVRNVKHNLANPSKSDPFGVIVLASQAGMDGARLRQAVVAYHAQHGAYPKSLLDLYTEGFIDNKLLHNGLDDSADPAHLSWRYTPPAENAPGNTPILEEPYHITLGNSTAPGKIVIDLDGHSQTNTGSRPGSADGTP